MAIESAVQLENKIARAKGFRTTITQNIHLHSHLKITSVFSAKLSFEFALNSSRCQQVVYNVHHLLQGSKSAQQ